MTPYNFRRYGLEQNQYFTMKKFLLLLVITTVFISCDHTTEIIGTTHTFALLPQPKEITAIEKEIVLSSSSALYSPTPELVPLMKLFAKEVQQIMGISLEITDRKGKNSDILFAIDSTMKGDEYRITTDGIIYLTGGSYNAVAMGKTTLLQLVGTTGNMLTFPVVTINDHPDAAYRGLMLDLARGWHTLETIKQTIDMAAFYKLNYLHLHFSDYQSYTLPSNILPNLPTPDRHYTFEELRDLEAYSQLRGITIIPEIDVPGHSSPFVENYPEIFAIAAIDKNPWIINMGKEEVYETLEKIIGEIAEIFQASPYIHIGGDEAIFYKSEEDPDVMKYVQQHEIGEDVHELYRHFLVRMNNIVKKYDKQMCVWEGFNNEGEIEIPKDIIVFEFETNRYLPNLLVEDGYTVVNTSWKPLYVVNNKKWEPKTIYGWNMWRWENWFEKAPSYTPIQVEHSPLIIGAQMCAWEQAGASEIPSLRKRLPAFMERVWNTKPVISYDQLMDRINILDTTLTLLINDDRQDAQLIDYNFEK